MFPNSSPPRRRFRGNLQQDAHEFLSDLIDFFHDELAEEDEEDDEDDSVSTPPAKKEEKEKIKKDDAGEEKEGEEKGGEASSSFKTPSPKAGDGNGTPGITPAAKKEAKAWFCEFPTDKCFSAEICATLTCKGCSWARSKTEVYRHFSLDIEEVGDNGVGVNQVKSINDALNNFFKPTNVGIRCEKCKCEEATKTLEIAKAPGCLLLHLKRFIVEEGVGKKLVYRKNGENVKFDGTVGLEVRCCEQWSGDLSCSITRPSNSSLYLFQRFAPKAGFTSGKKGKYELKSIVRHIGRDAASGHYVTCAKDKDERWTEYNDSAVSEVERSEVFVSGLSTGYVLCYEGV